MTTDKQDLLSWGLTLTRVRGNHWLKQPDNTNSPRLANHTMTYEESVLECADEYGCLTLKDAKRLFKEHGSDYWKAHNEGMPITLNAEKLLNWLGY